LGDAFEQLAPLRGRKPPNRCDQFVDFGRRHALEPITRRGSLPRRPGTVRAPKRLRETDRGLANLHRKNQSFRCPAGNHAPRLLDLRKAQVSSSSLEIGSA
jgi:hypothetical protein